MIYKGEFRNIDDRLISVYIGTSGSDIQDTSGQEKTILLLADNPVTITSASDGIFAPIKADSCTIRILTEKIYPDIYSNTAQGTSVMVKDEDAVIFYGYVTPNIYTQDYVGLDELEIEAISALSSLEYLRFSRSSNSFTSWYDIIKMCLEKTGYYDHFYFPDSFNYRSKEELDQPLLKVLYQFENNFFDDDQESTAWTYKEILSEFCKYLGLSLVVYNAELYFIDYEHTDGKYFLYNLPDDSVSEVVLDDLYVITAESYKESNAKLSFDDTYNKISIKDNLYEVNSMIPDMMENLVNQNVNSNKYYESTATIDKKDYTLLSAFFKSDDWYNYQPYSELTPDIMDNTTVDIINGEPYVSYASFWQKVANYETAEEPSSLDWTTYFTMYNDMLLSNARFVCQTYPKKDINLICNGGYFIINMDYKLSSSFKANDCLQSSDQKYSSTRNGTGYNNTLFPCRLYIGDYYYDGEKWVNKSEYQRKQAKGYYANQLELWEETRDPMPTWYKYKDSDGDWKFTNNKAVWDAATTEKESGSYKSWQHVYFIGAASSTYDDGTRIYIDEDYYHECILQDRFYLVHINEEDDQIFDKIKSLTNTVSWRMNIADSQDGIAIKLPSFILNGKLRFELYGSNELGIYPNYLTDGTSKVCKAIHIKNLEVLYKASDNVVSVFDNSVNSDDVVYTNIIDEDYVNEWNDMEIKINTQLDNRVTSYSSVLLKPSDDDEVTFCYNLLNKNVGEYRIQEHNLIEKYYNHYSSPKAILEVTLENKLKPYSRVKENNINKIFTFDSYELDIRTDVLRAKLIEY